MYQRDVADIISYTNTPENFYYVVLFVVLSIRTHFIRLPLHMRKVLTEGEESSILWGYKKKTISYVKENLRQLYDTTISKDREEALATMLGVPGLGLAKASFVLQCMGHELSCLDSHNLRLFNLKEPKKLQDYISTCDKIGSSEFFWNNWCNFIGEKYPKLGSGDRVSRMHYEIITNG